MSDDLIRRSDAIEVARHVAMEVITADGRQMLIESIPSADRPQGKWIEQEDCWQCSECGDEYVLEVGVKPIDARMHYCPNCGCWMKGADDD